MNRFHGDVRLFREGVRYLEQASGLPVLGVIPYAPADIPEEDSLSLVGPDLPAPAQPDGPAAGILTLAAVVHAHTANFTDLEPFRRRSDLSLRWARRPTDLAHVDGILLPGSRNSIDDLRAHRQSGMADAILAAAARGTVIVGLCGGLQMMGQTLEDPDAVEAAQGGQESGLGLLPLRTRFHADKRTLHFRGVVAVPDGPLRSIQVEGYEIHRGETTATGDLKPFLRVTDRSGEPAPAGDTDGFWRSARCWGTYMHGIFDTPALLDAFVASLREVHERGMGEPTPAVETTPSAPPLSMRERRLLAYDQVADCLLQSLDRDRLARLAGVDPERLSRPSNPAPAAHHVPL